ncbi:hypothetical protein [Porphyromonas sp.]
MKKVLGLDLGVGSIGWSLIALDKDERPAEILKGLDLEVYKPQGETETILVGDTWTINVKAYVRRNLTKVKVDRLGKISLL